MHRYATAPRSTFEELFEQARTGTVELAGAAYPPVCGGRSGRGQPRHSAAPAQ